MNSRNQTVCIIDDDSQVLSSLSILLQVAGFAVKVFESAEAFLTSLSSDLEFGCLVLDVRLPGMNGIELLEELESREIAVPVFLVSGHANDEMIKRGIANGAKSLFEKPFDGRKLVQAVSEAVSERE